MKQLEEFVAFNEELFRPVAMLKPNADGTPNLHVWNKIRFWLSQDEYYTHDLDAQMLVREEFVNGPDLVREFEEIKKLMFSFNK